MINSGTGKQSVMIEGMVTNKGGRKFGETGAKAIMPKEERFKSDDMKQNSPGPGQ